MGSSAWDGPLYAYGNLAEIGTSALVVTLPDVNADKGPSVFYQGTGIPDIRFQFLKDKVQGYTGVVPNIMHATSVISVSQIPSAAAANNIAAAANAVSGTAMTLAAASLGVTANVPIVPIGASFNSLNGSAVATAALALDFGFAFGNVTSGSKTVVVADSTLFSALPYMPIVIGGVGNAGGTIPLLTNVVSITDATHIVIADSPLATNTTAPIGTGNLWGPSENGFPTPTAALPYLGRGPGLFLDPRQTLSRGVVITGVSGGAGGNFLVSGWDTYGMPLTQLVTVGAGAVAGYSIKTFKYIASVVPQFSDAHNYTVGTTDVFGFAVYSDLWETTGVSWAGSSVGSSTGYIAGVQTNPSTNLLGDVRGTVQTSTNGGGSAIATIAAASNGSLSSLLMTGRRLFIESDISVYQMLAGGNTLPYSIYGQTQV